MIPTSATCRARSEAMRGSAATPPCDGGMRQMLSSAPSPLRCRHAAAAALRVGAHSAWRAHGRALVDQALRNAANERAGELTLRVDERQVRNRVDPKAAQHRDVSRVGPVNHNKIDATLKTLAQPQELRCRLAAQ